MLTQARDERGSVIIWMAFMLTVILGLGAITVDLGSWYTHKRHLQTQADAAALAAGSVWSVPCTTAGTGNTNQSIIDNARQFAGPSAAGNTGPYNRQVGTTPNSNVHVLLNSKAFYGQAGSGDFTDYAAGESATQAQPCAKNYLDVKITESNPLRFFDLSGIVGSLNTEARVQIKQLQADTDFVPLGVQIPLIYKAKATIRSCVGTNQQATLATVPLAKLPLAQQTQPGTTLWGPADGGGNPVPTFGITLPSFSQCAGDYMPVDVNVEVSGSPNVAPSLGNCSNKFVDCFDTVVIRDFKNNATAPTAEGDAPKFRDVHLSGACGSGTLYWASGTDATLPCNGGITADIDWGTLPTLRTGFTATVTATAGGGSAALTGSGSGTWGGSGVSSGDGIAEPQDVNLDWSYYFTQNGSSCKKSKPCNGTTEVHRANVSLFSPVTSVTVTNGNGGAVLDSKANDIFPTTLGLTVGIQSTFNVGQKVVLRSGASQGSGALNCDPNVPNGQTISEWEFTHHCKPLYAKNDGLADATWEPCPPDGDNATSYWKSAQTQPWKCTHVLPGGHGNQVPDGIALATGNCPGGIQGQHCNPVCVNRSFYDKNNPNQTFASDNPRIIRVFLTPWGALNGLTGNDSIEIVGFAAFYVTNWSTDPCNLDTDPLPSGADAVGYFVKIVDNNPGIPTDNTCDPTDVVPCQAVLVR